MTGSWWATKTRQFIRHLAGRVPAAERAALGTWVTPAQLDLFDAMHRADRRHGLDVVAALRRAGHHDPDVLLAGLLHDCGKGARVGVWHRVGWSLGQRYGRRARAVGERLPGFRAAYADLDTHAERSSVLALAAGCSTRTAALIRNQADPVGDTLGEALRLADEAS